MNASHQEFSELLPFYANGTLDERERAQLEEARAALEIEAQRRLDAQRHEVEQRARAAEAERGRLREAELQKTHPEIVDVVVHLEPEGHEAEAPART